MRVKEIFRIQNKFIQVIQKQLWHDVDSHKTKQKLQKLVVDLSLLFRESQFINKLIKYNNESEWGQFFLYLTKKSGIMLIKK